MSRSLLALLPCAIAVLQAAEPSGSIRVGQAGYLISSPKLAVVASPTAEKFLLRVEKTGKVAFEGALGPSASDPLSGDTVRTADFTAFSKPGRYYLEVPGAGRGDSFDIGNDVFRRAYYLSMRSFYGQRCGIAVDMGPEFRQFRHDACHTNGAWHASSGKSGPRPSAYGWHDAGDYGRYTVNSGISTGTLLWAWELYGKSLAKIRLDIPESKNRTPDHLDEIRWNLEWMLTMQDDDGGVWHKQTTERFSGFVMPEKDTAPSVVIGSGSAPFKTSCATGDFAAVMAVAGRLYTPYDKAFAARALKAAEAAWTWLDANPGVLFRNPAGVSTGAYGDSNCSDERLWAAAELWRSTGSDAYHRFFLANYAAQADRLRLPSWANVGPLALWTYALASRPGRDDDARDRILSATVALADQAATRTAASAYHTAMQESDFTWGSNSVAANYAMLLLVARELTGRPAYRDAALEEIHYLLGRNPFSTSWVTAVGSRWYMHPHHRPSGADGVLEPWPGLLAGGPNRSRQDPAMKTVPEGTRPMRMWIDDQGSYASNEICLNWNAPLVFVLAASLK